MPKDADSTRLESFKNALLQNHDVSYVAAASSVPGDKIPVNLVNDGGTDFSKAVSVQMLFTDIDFVRAMQMQVVAGRTFDKSVATDKTMGFVINEEAVKKLGWKDAPWCRRQNNTMGPACVSDKRGQGDRSSERF
jgi:putative ABC transport system permease protein